MTFLVSSNFFGDFKLGDNVRYNVEVLRTLYAAQKRASESEALFRKPITILLASVAEALLYDLFWRMKHHTREGVPNVAAEVLELEREKSRDKFETVIAGIRKHRVLCGDDADLPDRLDKLRKVRNRVHIQNSKGQLEKDEANVFTAERLEEAERLVEEILRQMSGLYPRPSRLRGYVRDLELPWGPHCGPTAS